MSEFENLVSIHDLATGQVDAILDLGRRIKADPAAWTDSLRARTVAMLFEKPSLRTRTTFEAGMAQMGGHAIYLSQADIGMGSREAVPDVARNLERWVDAIVARTFEHRTVLDLAENASIPVINALSDLLHPCQILADLMTLREEWGELEGRTVAWVGDGNNVCHSLAYGCAKTGLRLRIGTPESYAPRSDVLEEARWDAERAARGAEIVVVEDPVAAVRQADAVYTDVWTSMGQEEESERRRQAFQAYRVDADLMAEAHSSAVFLHCLPAHRGEEVTAEVLDGEQSRVLEQAENRLHVQKAALLLLLDAE